MFTLGLTQVEGIIERKTRSAVVAPIGDLVEAIETAQRAVDAAPNSRPNPAAGQEEAEPLRNAASTLDSLVWLVHDGKLDYSLQAASRSIRAMSFGVDGTAQPPMTDDLYGSARLDAYNSLGRARHRLYRVRRNAARWR